MSTFELPCMKTACTVICKDKALCNTKLIINCLSATTQLPTQPTLLTFCLLLNWVHLDLQTQIYNFSFEFFLSKSTLISARAQIKQLGPFDSLPIYKSAKIKLFGQISFSIF